MNYTQGKWGNRGNMIFVEDTYVAIACVSIQKILSHKERERGEKDLEMKANISLIKHSPEMFNFLLELSNSKLFEAHFPASNIRLKNLINSIQDDGSGT